MKFITEYELRSKFNEQPFAEYQMEENVRLTPGARQFLTERGVKLLEEAGQIRSALENKKLTGKEIDSETIKDESAEVLQETETDDLKMKKLLSSIEVLEAEVLILSRQLLGEKIEIAEQLSRTVQEFAMPEQEEILPVVADKVNQIINRLSMLICMASGGKECGRIQ